VITGSTTKVELIENAPKDNGIICNGPEEDAITEIAPKDELNEIAQKWQWDYFKMSKKMMGL